MNMQDGLLAYRERVEAYPALRWQGQVSEVVGSLICSSGPFCSVGEVCHVIDGNGRVLQGEVVGFRGTTVLSMPLGSSRGIGPGNRILAWGERPAIPVSEGLLGCVVDASGRPLDSKQFRAGGKLQLLDADPPGALERSAIREPMSCGIRAVDAFITCGRGQRIGIFGGSGVGKSTLIGMMTRNTSADLTVLGLVGERGREVREFLESALGGEGRRRAVVVVSTSDQSPLLRIRAAFAATAVAEYFSGQGKNVLLIMDSLTRVAMAQREIGLAAGEPPTAKGYTPSCFSMLARLIERAGNFGRGSITAFYTVLMEGDDEQDPLVDGARALLDGHIMLDRKLAVRSHYPPVDVLGSISRLMSAVCTTEHLHKAHELRRLLAAYIASEDLIRIGAYQKGSDPTLDKALALIPELHHFLMQGAGESASFSETISKLMALPG